MRANVSLKELDFSLNIPIVSARNSRTHGLRIRKLQPDFFFAMISVSQFQCLISIFCCCPHLGSVASLGRWSLASAGPSSLWRPGWPGPRLGVVTMPRLTLSGAHPCPPTLDRQEGGIQLQRKGYRNCTVEYHHINYQHQRAGR